MSKVTSDLPYVCDVPDCGRAFSRPSGLGRHMSETHGRKTTREATAEKRAEASPLAASGSGWYEQQVATRLRELAAPLKEQLAEIDGRLAVITAETAELRKGRAEIVAVLSRLDPQEATKHKGGGRATNGAHANGAVAKAAKDLDAKYQAVEKIIKSSPERFADGFTANVLAETLTTEVPRGMSVQSAMRVIDRLRDANLVRADRVTRGGGMTYKLVGKGG